MADGSGLPEGLDTVLQCQLLPRLSLAGLQSLAQTCCSTNHLVKSAQPDIWITASQRHRLPAFLFETASNPYSTAAKLASRHAAVKAGPAHCRTVQGQAGKRQWGNIPFAALQPDFDKLVSMRVPHVFVTPMHSAADGGCASGFSVQTPSGRFHLADLWYGEQQCAPDGQHFVAINCCTAWDKHGYGLSLFAVEPVPRVVETYDLTGMGKEAIWSPDSSLFLVMAENIGYVCSVPGRLAEPAHMRELPASPLNDCSWSPCSTLIAASCTQQYRLIIRALDGAILSKVETPDPGDAWVNSVGWINPDGQPIMVFNQTNQAAADPRNDVQLQMVQAQAFCFGGTFSSPMFVLRIGYRTAEGYRVAGLTETSWVLVLHHLTSNGIVSSKSTQGMTGCCSVPRIAWAPNDSVRLAVLGVAQENAGGLDIHVARLQVLDGRSGRVVHEVIVAESSFRIYPTRLEWSASGQGLLVGFDYNPHVTFAFEHEHIKQWVKKYFRFK